MPVAKRKPRAAPTPEVLNEPAAAAPWVILAQSGGRPYRFQGTAIAEANGYRSGAQMWYTITLYARSTKGYAAYVRSYQKSVDQIDYMRVLRADSIAAIASKLEAYNPEDDIDVSFDAVNDDLTAVQSMLHSAYMRSALDEARGGYKALVGDFLFEISGLID